MAATPPGEAPGASPARFADLRTRILSATALAVVALTDLYLGGIWTMLFVAAACGVMMWEFRSVTLHRGGAAGWDAAYPVSAVAGAAAVAVLWSPAAALIWLAWGLAVSTGVDLAADRRGGAAWGAVGIVYLGLAGIAFLYLRGAEPHGFAIVVWLFLVVAASDIGGYFAGRVVGGPKLWPRVSPKKTWAGTLGGIALATAVGAGTGAVLPGADALRLGAISAITAMVSQAGDLAESALKRHFGVKDSGRLLPGHGGLLDRFDGLIAASLAVGLVTWWRGATVFGW